MLRQKIIKLGESIKKTITYNNVTTSKPWTQTIRCKTCDGYGKFKSGNLRWNGTGYVYGSLEEKLEKAKSVVLYDYGMLYEGLATANLNGKYGYADASGKIVIPVTYKYATQFSEGLAYVIIDNKGFYIDKTGSQIFSIPFEYGSTFKDGMASVSLNNKEGFIDKAGKVIVYPKYDNVSQFAAGMAFVSLNGKGGFIDKTGKVIIALKYDVEESDVIYFHDGLACVELNGYKGYIDKAGKVAIPFKYLNAWEFSKGLARVSGNKGGGLINTKGIEIVPAIYDYVEFLENGIIEAKLNGKSFHFDKTGKSLNK